MRQTITYLARAMAHLWLHYLYSAGGMDIYIYGKDIDSANLEYTQRKIHIRIQAEPLRGGEIIPFDRAFDADERNKVG